MKLSISKQSKLKLVISVTLLLTLLLCSTLIPIASAKSPSHNSSNHKTTKKNDDPSNNGGITSKIIHWINGGDEYHVNNNIQTLSLMDISEMRVRDIKRRLTRTHGYGADEIAQMLDKKELINALAFEEHKAELKEKERKKRIAFKRSIMVALACVIFVMFKGLFVHVYEIAAVNFVVYTDKKKYEWNRCREFKSMKGLFGLFLTIMVNMLQLWLSISVILSWVLKSKYFFPVPYIPIKPAALLSSASGTSVGGPFENYGLNIGPMFVSGLFRFLNGQLELFMGKALSDALKKQKKERKAAKKEEEKVQAEILRQERKAARRARRAEREQRKQAAAAATKAMKDNTNYHNDGECREDSNNVIHNGHNPNYNISIEDIDEKSNTMDNEAFVGGINDLD